MALKVFKPRFRLPFLVSQAEKLALFADLPGMQAARRLVLTPQRNAELLHQYPDLIYAVLMPWIDGPTWEEVLLGQIPLTPQQSLALGRSLADVLSVLEQHGVAHCDLSAPNVMLPELAGGEGVALVDLEGFYAPGMLQPQALSTGSAGYAHKQAAGGLWGPEADRFAGAVLLAEMLGWCDERVREASWGESYFGPDEMQEDTERYRLLVNVLRERWGEGVARLFERAWRSDTLTECPTFGEWLVMLLDKTSSVATAEREAKASTLPLAIPSKAALVAVRAFMWEARQMEEKGELDEVSKETAPDFHGVNTQSMDEWNTPQSKKRSWMWGVIFLLVAFIVALIGSGVWLMFESSHQGSGPENTTSLYVAPTNTPYSVASYVPSSTLAPSPSLAVVPARKSTPLPTLVPTVTPTYCPSLTPTRSCSRAVGLSFDKVWEERRTRLGCATNTLHVTWVANEEFERGEMFWRKDTDDILVLYDTGRWVRYDNIWHEGDPEYSCTDIAPSQSPPAPRLGFGKVWCTYPAVREGVGWALDKEGGFYGIAQDFERGHLIGNNKDTIYVLYGDGRWERER